MLSTSWGTFWGISSFSSVFSRLVIGVLGTTSASFGSLTAGKEDDLTGDLDARTGSCTRTTGFTRGLHLPEGLEEGDESEERVMIDGDGLCSGDVGAEVAGTEENSWVFWRAATVIEGGRAINIRTGVLVVGILLLLMAAGLILMDRAGRSSVAE